jgi:ubiquinone/menaquinone biosynthesis C-methylase UbiE
MTTTARPGIFTIGFVNLVRHFVNRTRPKFNRQRHLFEGKHGLEIGGPSHIFSKAGALPVYEIANSIDNLDFSNSTFWIPGDRTREYRPSQSLESGNNFYIDSHELVKMAADRYDFLIASHVIEHVANPIKSILEWKRLLKPNGSMILIAPCKHFSYDCDRPTTTIAHLIEDYQRNVGEDDLSHLDEVISKHNLKKDKTISDLAQHIERTKQNPVNRIMHHHVFDLKLLRVMGEYCGMLVLEGEYILPRHVVCIFVKQT